MFVVRFSWEVFDEKISFEKLSIYIGGISVKGANTETLKKLSEYLKNNSTVQISIHLGAGSVSKRLWGCDFTEGYIQENAYYTT